MTLNPQVLLDHTSPLKSTTSSRESAECSIALALFSASSVEPQIAASILGIHTNAIQLSWMSMISIKWMELRMLIGVVFCHPLCKANSAKSNESNESTLREITPSDPIKIYVRAQLKTPAILTYCHYLPTSKNLNACFATWIFFSFGIFLRLFHQFLWQGFLHLNSRCLSKRPSRAIFTWQF